LRFKAVIPHVPPTHVFQSYTHESGILILLPLLSLVN